MVQWATRHSDFIRGLPPADAPAWRARDIFGSPPLPKEFWNAVERGLLEPVGEVVRGKHGTATVATYQISQTGQQVIEQNNLRSPNRDPIFCSPSDSRCPVCGSVRFQNVSGVEGLRCKECENVTPKGEWE